MTPASLALPGARTSRRVHPGTGTGRPRGHREVEMRRRRHPFVLSLVAFLILALAAPLASAAVAEGTTHPVVESCRFSRRPTGDRLLRGFYVSDFSGSDIHSVTLKYTGDDGTYHVRLS